MEILSNVNLKEFNTLFVDAKASSFVTVRTKEDVLSLLDTFDFKKKRHFILGEGSNTLFKSDYDGLVLQVEIMEREKISEDDTTVRFRLGSGEIWRDIVVWLAEQGYSGVENMAHIPGTVGAAPVGNIAAYGQVVEDVFIELEAIDLETGESKIFKGDDMNFRYRHSIFKENGFGKYLVYSVTLQLSKEPSFDTAYHSRYKNESLAEWLQKVASPPYKPIDIVNAVTALRNYKLPWMDQYGCCGSFFINPFIRSSEYHELSKKISELQQYPVSKMDYHRNDWKDVAEDEIVKIPAGRLLDELGWRGKWDGNVGTFDKHALCVVTNKKASGDEVYKYTEDMKRSVKEAFGIELVSEIVIV